ncbi:MAG TPA: Nif3-like dinuclear metal center hexameric protein [Methanospirillum sp.]|uniref:Nif3-like dinuclear metal center hexameric protein n=1 Tax=Methanospirillum sp. TaxID=45200 RepID=UPI002C49524E|nr:Nif3-like dinuclear metal center hexameric protein [Methanospirillum sp.]HOJ96278.1 Nif3-like dinuclear metal center hexameric protein [Methanospirillum sp.]HPP76693.1 Nif3-like dinuclear metal center hexameric protein [Methanospirillum sp.]
MTSNSSRVSFQSRDEILGLLTGLAPPELAEPFDAGRIGLIIEGKEHITKICTCLDVTPYVVQKAIEKRTDLLIAHHTPIWTPLTSISGDDARLFSMILRAEMNVYVMHTNWDHVSGGVNDILADLLGLKEREPMTLGLVGSCSGTLEDISRILRAPLRIWGEVSDIHRLAIVAGSGFDSALIREAHSCGADAFLSAELRHSVYRSSPIPLLESTHYALESPAMRVLAEHNGWEYIEDMPVLHSLS